LRRFAEPEVIADLWFVRGFVEHVAIRAERFLELADRLFAVAPIRHLTLIDCTGHQDRMRFERLIDSHHLARIRSLQFPGRLVGKPQVLLNELQTARFTQLARSPHLGRLAYLEVRDQWRVDAEALDAFVGLPALRMARWARYRYPSSGPPILIEKLEVNGRAPAPTFFDPVWM
jgi:hypothetical protein